jgi:hypothetical protein
VFSLYRSSSECSASGSLQDAPQPGNSHRKLVDSVDEKCLLSTEDATVDDHSKRDNQAANPPPTTSLPLWAHRYGREPACRPINDQRIDEGNEDVDHLLSAGLVGVHFIRDGKGDTRKPQTQHWIATRYDQIEHQENIDWIQSLEDGQRDHLWVEVGEEAQTRAASDDQSDVDNPQVTSTHIVSRNHGQGPFSDITLGPLPTMLPSYQVGLWAYGYVKTEIPLSERLEQSRWQPYCASL